MNIFTEVEAKLRKAIEELKADGTLPLDLEVPIECEITRNAAHGDISTNIAMVIASELKRNENGK